jgi:hypothetical protein
MKESWLGGIVQVKESCCGRRTAWKRRKREALVGRDYLGYERSANDKKALKCRIGSSLANDQKLAPIWLRVQAPLIASR